MGGAGSGRRPIPDLALVEEAGTIQLGRFFSGLSVGSPLPVASFFLPPDHGRHYGVIATLTLAGWDAGELLADLVYDMFSPDICVKNQQMRVRLSRGRYQSGRWAFLCPGGTPALACGKSVRKLHVHPQSGKLGCRTCLALRYRSTVGR